MASYVAHRLFSVVSAFSNRGGSLSRIRFWAGANIDRWKFELGRVESVGGVVCLHSGGAPAQWSQPNRFVELRFPAQPCFFGIMDGHYGKESLGEEHKALFVANIMDDWPTIILHQGDGRRAKRRGIQNPA